MLTFCSISRIFHEFYYILDYIRRKSGLSGPSSDTKRDSDTAQTSLTSHLLHKSPSVDSINKEEHYNHPTPIDDRIR